MKKVIAIAVCMLLLVLLALSAGEQKAVSTDRPSASAVIPSGRVSIGSIHDLVVTGGNRIMHWELVPLQPQDMKLGWQAQSQGGQTPELPRRDRSTLYPHLSRLNVLTVQSFPAGHLPEKFAFANGNIWITDRGNFHPPAQNSVVIEMNESGNILKTVAVEKSPIGIAYDGVNLWVANQLSGDVSVVDPVAGAVVKTVVLTGQPFDVVFDGASIWVCDQSGGEIWKLDTAGNILFSENIAGEPSALVWDGAAIWAAQQSANTLTKIEGATGAILGIFSTAQEPGALAFDGADVWVANRGSNSVSKFQDSNGALLGTFPVGSLPSGIAWDGTHIWVSNSLSNNVSELDPATGGVLTTTPVLLFPTGAFFDSLSRAMWFADAHSNEVSKVQGF